MKNKNNNSVEKIHIENLSKKREEYVKVWQESWDEEAGHYTSEENPEIDKLSNLILDCIKTWRFSLPFEFIIEELTKLGQAPCLLYDDNGHFAVSGDGFQSVALEEAIDMEMSHFIEKEAWKDSIRQALDYYLDNEEF